MFNLALPNATRQRKVFYAIEVDMRLSFDRLAKIAEKQLGASLELGDIVVFDNKNADKRKFLLKTKQGMIQVYGRLDDKLTFLPLAKRAGLVRDFQPSRLFQ